MEINASGYLDKAHQINSPNCDNRPSESEINLLVIHNISLPPNEYGGNGVIELFTNQINPSAHPYYQSLVGVKVSTHFFIRRDGDIIQFVSCLKRAWHAGVSSWQDKTHCNDFSIGIELEGCDTEPFTGEQYEQLTKLTQAIQSAYPVTEIAGHSDIAPGRKTDPGPHFDWNRYRASLHHWEQIFVGRETELQWLQQTWAEVKRGKPRFCVLRGESGFGKTKIVQKFYSWLSHRESEDPNGYWPDTLLREQNNLRVNPRPEDFSECTDIPWLWWGIGWNNPLHRNLSESDRCGLLASLPHLKPHEIALCAHKNRQNRAIKIVAEAAPLLAENVINIATAGLVSTFKSLFEFGKTAHDEYQAHHQETLSIEERQQQIQRARLDKLHELLTHVMTSATHAPALPLILVLDDAQWIDQASTRFIGNLFHHAIQNDWPLLILATHWEQEWNLALDQEIPAHHLPGLCQKISANDQNRLSLRDIDRLTGLEVIIKAALPVLTDEQVAFLSQRADGNPLLLNEILQELQNERWYFQGQDLTQPLIQSALDKMAQKSFKLHDVQARRYHQMSEQLKTLLSYASYQGMRFNKDLLLDIAVHMDNTLASSEVGETLSSAIRPHAILAASNAVIYEFRHRGFYDLARQRIELLPEIQTRLAEQIITVGRQWLQQGNAKELPEDEQESFYLLLLAQAVPLQSDPAFHLQLLVALLEHYQLQGYYSRAIKHLEAFEMYLPDDAQIDFDTLPFWTQLGLIDLFKELNRIETAEKLAHAVQQQCTAHLSRHGDSEQRLRDVSISQDRVADVLLKRDAVEEALTLYQVSLATREQILQAYGDSEQRLRDVSISQNKVADVLLKRDAVEEALTLYQASLATCEQILQAYGDSEQRLRDVSISQDKVADVLLKRDAVEGALTLYQASLATREQILQTYGDSEQRLRDVSISQNKVADVLLKRDAVEEALTLYQASLATCEQILQAYGDSEQRLRDVFISYFKLFICFSENKPKQCELLCEALSYSEKRLLNYPQYAAQAIAEHEQLLQIAEPILQGLNDETFNHQFNSFQQNLARYKHNMGI